MSITCSIPGCSATNTNLRLTKLYRIPAVPIASSGFIHDLTNTRRRKWMEILTKCGLTEENCANFRVCSKHFTEGKPAPSFDSKNPDWVPHLNLCTENKEPFTIETRKSISRRKTMSSATSKKPESRSRSTSGRKSPESIRGRSKSVSRYRRTKSVVKEEQNDPPFVFVDIQKIKEGVSVADTTLTTTSDAKKTVKGMSLRSFGTQTNPNILPPLNWGRSRSRKQADPRYRNVAVQTTTTKTNNEETSEACLGEMIDYIRKQMLDFIFEPFGKSYKITECAIHVEKQLIDGNVDKEKSVVIVQSNKLLSSNWPLLETIAKSLDLYKKEKKQELNLTDVVRTFEGKKETLDYATTVDTNVNEAETPENMKESITSVPVTSPTVTPKITNVISIGDLIKTKQATGSEQKRRNTSSKTLPKLEVPPTITVPKVVDLTGSDTAPKKRGRKKLKIDRSEVITKLGTNKIPRIILPKLPDSIIETCRNGGTIPATMFGDKNNFVNVKTTAPVSTPIILNLPGNMKTTAQLCLSSTLPKDTTNSVKNIPLKLPEKEGIAGYIVLSKTGVASNPYLYVVPGPVTSLNNTNTPEKGKNHAIPTISRLFATPARSLPTVVPVTSTPIVQPKTAPDSSIETIPETDPQIEADVQISSTLSPVGKAVPPVVTTVSPVGKAISPIGKTVSPAGKTNSPVGKTVSPLGKTVLSVEKTVSPVRKTVSLGGHKVSSFGKTVPIIEKSVSPSVKTVPQVDKTIPPIFNTETQVATPENQTNETVPQIENTLLDSLGNRKNFKCPYCSYESKDKVEFIVHYKRCRGNKSTMNTMLKCNKCRKYYLKTTKHTCNLIAGQPLIECNVCGRGFIKCANLANHVKIHTEYSLWTHKCAQCPKKFETEKLLEEHKVECELLTLNKRKFSCKQCTKVFVIESRLEAHVKTVHLSKENSPTAPRNVKVKCRRCDGVFDLKYYRSTHWKMCKPTPESDDLETDEDSEISKKSETDRTTSKDRKMERQKQDNVMKPMGIRSCPFDNSSDDDLGESIEDQLQKMFEDNEQNSICEQVKLIEDFEEKIIPNEINSGQKRKFENSDDDGDGLLGMKISRLDDDKNPMFSNGINIEETDTDNGSEICLQSTFDMTDCLNEISFEEVEEVELSDS